MMWRTKLELEGQMDLTYGFDPKRDDIHDLLDRARRVGITIAPNGRIHVWRRGWKEGQPITTHTVYRTFQEAIRAHTHTLDSIFERSDFDEDLRREFEGFHAWLLTSDLPPRAKHHRATERLRYMLEQLTGVRCANLWQLRAHLRGHETLLTKSVAELLEGKYWGACCGKIVFRLNPTVTAERKRVLWQGPKVLYKRQLLQKIWGHDKWLAEQQLNRLDALAQHYALVRILVRRSVDEERKQWLLEGLRQSLNLTLKEFGVPFYNQVKFVRNKLMEVKNDLEKGIMNEGTDEILDRARGTLRSHREWLLRVDSRRKPKTAAA